MEAKMKLLNLEEIKGQKELMGQQEINGRVLLFPRVKNSG
jgi:hypothetical protein